MNAEAPTASTAQSRNSTEEETGLCARTLELVRALARELHPEMPRIGQLDADASFERDFGLDSLARVELALRIEQMLAVRLADEALAEVDTVRDLAHALLGARSATAARSLPEAERPAGRPLLAPLLPTTLIDALEWQASHQGERAHILLIDRDTQPDAFTFGALRAAAAAVAAGLVRRGIRPRESVAIMLPTERAFFAAFYGALYAGAVPVPLYPPSRRSQIEMHLRRVAGIVANCEARALVTVEAARPLGDLLWPLGTRLQVIATVAELSEPPGGTASPAAAAAPTDTAFLQYTSGSTGQPKGVVLTHANVLANLNALQRATGITAEDCFVSWLPLYHDMGLIGAAFGALVFGFPLVLMSPTAFLAEPLRWLRAVDRYRGTITAAPNFAYETCVNQTGDAAPGGLDLGTLRLAFSGAEAVSASTLERFAERFAPCGLRRSALTPAYGLAECALGLTMPPPERGPLIDRIDRDTFLRTGRALRSRSSDTTGLTVVSCGKPIPGHSVRIVDATGTVLPERTQGRIEFRGPSATGGYFRNSEETRRLFDGEWLDSGDLGYLSQGELYVTGRAKDVIIRGGQHVHPNELEEAIGRLPGVCTEGVAAFAATDRRSGTERIVVLIETRERETAGRESLVAQVNRLAVELTGLPVDAVVLVPPETILKTPSGKIRHGACREAYERGEFSSAHRAPWMQAVRLTLQGWLGKSERMSNSLRTSLWGVWALCVAATLVPGLWLALLLVPGLQRRRRIGAAFVRLAARLADISIAVSGLVDTRGTRVYVSNHASYLDALVLIATLPPEVTFVAKREFAQSRLLGPLFRRLGCLFVERHAAHEALTSAAEMQAALAARCSLLVFPEGTFQREPGLLPFHMGAFHAAAATAAAVVPVALRGTRTMLPDGAYLPRPTALEVIIGTPLAPDDASWHAAVKLRSLCREHILARTREPDLERRSPPAAV